MKKISIVVLILIFVTTSTGIIYGEDLISKESIVEVSDNNTIYIATENEETGETIYS